MVEKYTELYEEREKRLRDAIELKKPEQSVDDPGTEIQRDGARKLLMASLETEIEAFLNKFRGLVDEKGRQRVVRNGYLPER